MRRIVAALALSGCCILPPAPTPAPGLGPSATPTAPLPPPSSPEEPVRSPYCRVDDTTGVPLATSAFVSTIPLEAARGALDARNEICGDTWCEGSFEWYAYDLRGDGSRSELTLRTYSYQEEPVADVSSIVVSGPSFTGRVLGQHVVPSCSSACAAWYRQAPCLVLDVRCELGLPWRDETFDDAMPWEEAAIACGIALESAIRARVPEQFGPE